MVFSSSFSGERERRVRLSRSSFSRLSSRSFRLRLHPNTSLRESVLPFTAVVQVPSGPDTEYSAATVSHCMAVSIRLTLGSRAESKCHLRLALQARASSRGEGPMQPSSFVSAFLVFVFPRGSREPLPPSPSPRSSPRADGDRGDGEGAKGRPPFVEPEPRSVATTPPRPGVSAAADRPPRTVRCSSPCAK